MTTFQDYCAALDKLNALIWGIEEHLGNHPASQFGEITVELPREFSEWWGECTHLEHRPIWRLRYDELDSEKTTPKQIIWEFWDDSEGANYWENPEPIENLGAVLRIGIAPYLPLLIKRADELLELQTAELEQTVQGIYEALEAAKKNGLPTAKPGKKRK